MPGRLDPVRLGRRRCFGGTGEVNAHVGSVARNLRQDHTGSPNAPWSGSTGSRVRPDLLARTGRSAAYDTPNTKNPPISRHTRGVVSTTICRLVVLIVI